MGSGVSIPALGDLRSSLPALPPPPCQVTGRLLFPQMETHSWLLPPWTRCWPVSQDPGVPPALQVSAEGSSTDGLDWVPHPGLGLGQGDLKEPLGGPGPWQGAGDWVCPNLLFGSSLVRLDKGTPSS